jgi:hypothetical protein
MATIKEREPREPGTATAELLKAAQAEVVVTDARGRKITLRKPGVLSQFRLIRVLGAEASANGTYVNMVLPLTFVTAIDGAPQFAAQNEIEIEHLIQQLDEDGILAVMNGVQDNFAAADPEAQKNAVKE